MNKEALELANERAGELEKLMQERSRLEAEWLETKHALDVQIVGKRGELIVALKMARLGKA
jgi:hypothetical protein